MHVCAYVKQAEPPFLGAREGVDPAVGEQSQRSTASLKCQVSHVTVPQPLSCPVLQTPAPTWGRKLPAHKVLVTSHMPTVGAALSTRRWLGQRAQHSCICCSSPGNQRPGEATEQELKRPWLHPKRRNANGHSPSYSQLQSFAVRRVDAVDKAQTVANRRKEEGKT